MLARVPPIYSRAEYITDAVIHVSGITLALIGGPILVTLAALWTGDPGLVGALAIYGVSLLAMLTCSALYNIVLHPGWTELLRRIDQSAICLKIAGTYTPFVALAGSGSGWFLATIWSVALTGVSVILFAPGRLRFVAIVLYLGLGWAGLAGGASFIASLSTAAFGLVLAGGVIYSVGVLFLIWERLPFHNTIWHLFVLAGSGVLYAALAVELAARIAHLPSIG